MTYFYAIDLDEDKLKNPTKAKKHFTKIIETIYVHSAGMSVDLQRMIHISVDSDIFQI